MNPNGSTDTLSADRSLKWQYNYANEMTDYYVTILTDENSFVAREWFQPTAYTGGVEKWHIPTSISLDPGRKYKWRIEMEAEYDGEYEYSGSESLWATFKYSSR